jgi:hypothetical protein
MPEIFINLDTEHAIAFIRATLTTGPNGETSLFGMPCASLDEAHKVEARLAAALPEVLDLFDVPSIEELFSDDIAFANILTGIRDSIRQEDVESLRAV